MGTNEKNMTTGSPGKLIITFAIPLMLGNILQQFYTMADTMIVGQVVGVEALAAVGAGDWLVWLVFGIMTGITQGFSILVAQFYGAREKENLKCAVAKSYIMTALLSVIVLAVSEGAVYHVLLFLQTPDNVIDLTMLYLHYDDISRTNMTIHVRETKGRIDRYTILSQKNLDLLTEYWYKCGRPKDILFPSSWSGGYLDIASVNQFFKKSAKLAGINRHVSSHACRHSFASHLFESGTDIKYIQSLLGHVDPRSTDVYLHVSNKTLLGIRSPFDNPEGGES